MNSEKRLPVFHGLAIFDEYSHDFTRNVSFNFIHQFHRFDDAKHLPRVHLRAHVDKRPSARSGRGIKRPHNR